MPENAESFEGESGLLDDYDALITDAWFSTDARINNGDTLCLFWKMQVTVDGEVQEEEIEEFWPCGPDWESLDGGDTAEHPKGKGKFNKASKVQRMIAMALEAGAGSVLASRGTAQTSKIWVGLKFHMKRDSYEYNYQGKPGKAEILGPVAFLGEGDGAAAVSSGSSTTPTPETGPSELLTSLSDETRAALKEIKDKSEGSHNAFVDGAMELTAVTSDSNLVMAIADPDGLYKEL